ARPSEVQQQRERSGQSRTREGLFLAALVGYTNVGKSTLMNALAGADVLVADQPFATLDPTTRRMALPRGGAILLSDTVGFVNKLPPTLVAAFRATLEELNDADLLVHVADAGHPNIHERIAVVRETLSSLGLSDRPSLIVFNKVDTLRGPEGASVREALEGEFPGAVFTSASTGTPTRTIYLPNITKTLGGPSGWVTPFIVQNIGVAPTDLDVSFYRFGDGALMACRRVVALQPFRSFADYPNADIDLPGNTQFSVVVRSFGADVIAVVNEHQGAG